MQANGRKGRVIYRGRLALRKFLPVQLLSFIKIMHLLTYFLLALGTVHNTMIIVTQVS